MTLELLLDRGSERGVLAADWQRPEEGAAWAQFSRE